MDTISSYFRWFTMKVLQVGPIPKHVAFIMDGNRRYARKTHIQVQKGHQLGFETLKQVLDVCLHLGIKIVSVYAFSIENFKREKSEVDALMTLAKDRMTELRKSDILIKHQVSVRVIGDISMLPQDLQYAIVKLVNDTKNYQNAILNICVAYTSRYEICHAVKCLAEGVEENLIDVSDISENLLEQVFYTNAVPDMLVRTSGEIRLSDYLLWQTSFSCLQFMDVLWPELSAWHVFLIVMLYQQNYKSIQESREKYEEQLRAKSKDSQSSQKRIEAFLKQKQHKDELIYEQILKSFEEQSSMYNTVDK